MHVSATTASTPLRNGLAKLARAEGFFTMSTSLLCAGVNPDVASRFVTVTAFGKTRTVTAHGACNPAFEELYAVLAASVGVTLPASTGPGSALEARGSRRGSRSRAGPPA